jgi:RNA polymerase sigma-70 factor (ECF subfamily)
MALPGSRRNVQRLVEEHYESLYRYAYRLSGQSAEAEDLTQEAFCKAQLCLAQLRDPARARAWLFRIVRNVYLHKLRAERQHPCLSLDDLSDIPEPAPGPLPAIDPEQLQEALDDLPEPFRTPVILFYFDEFSYKDIALHMELPIGTVMSRLARAKAYLRARLQPERLETSSPRRATDGL